MSVRSELVVAEGTVVEVLPSTTFRIKVDNAEHILLCCISGKLRKHNIRITLGDRVRFESHISDLSKGRIIFRL